MGGRGASSQTSATAPVRIDTFKQFKELFDGFKVGDEKFAPKVNRFASVSFKDGEKWFLAMDYDPSFGWDGIAAYRADTQELFTLDGIDGPNGMKATDELIASYGATKSDCVAAMMGR